MERRLRRLGPTVATASVGVSNPPPWTAAFFCFFFLGRFCFKGFVSVLAFASSECTLVFFSIAAVATVIGVFAAVASASP